MRHLCGTLICGLRPERSLEPRAAPAKHAPLLFSAGTVTAISRLVRSNFGLYFANFGRLYGGAGYKLRLGLGPQRARNERRIPLTQGWKRGPSGSQPSTGRQSLK